MNELSVSVLNIGSLVVLVIALVVWFFINRASNRVNKQIALLEEVVALQKRQNALLRRLCEANDPEPDTKPVAQIPDNEGDDDFSRLVAER